MTTAKRRTPTRTATRSRKSTAAKPSPSKSHDGNTRERVHKLTLRALRDHDLTLGDIPKLAQQMIEGAAAGLNSAVPASSRNVLRQVVDGLTDAAEATVHSTKTLVTATTKRGAKFVKHDAAKAVKDLRTIEEEFVSAMASAGRKLTGAAREELDTIVRHSRRAGTRIKPAAQSVLKVADNDLLELGKETARSSTRAARSAVSTVLQGASGFLQGLGDVVNPKPTRRTTKKAARRS